jgi:hypothetical protein
MRSAGLTMKVEPGTGPRMSDIEPEIPRFFDCFGLKAA